jgi:hypothetical protein
VTDVIDRKKNNLFPSQWLFSLTLPTCGAMPLSQSCGTDIILLIVEQLRHHRRLVLYCSEMSSCGFHANLWRNATFLKDYTAHHWAVLAAFMPTSLFIVASLPLPHSCGIMLFRKQYETNLCCLVGWLAVSLLSWLKSSSCRMTCGIIANLLIFIVALLLFCHLRRHCHLIFIVASLSLPHSCGILLFI